MAASNDIGIKASNIGFDVETAGDADLFFTSAWPQLKIYETDTVTIDSAGDDLPVKHDLTYPPLALAWNPIIGLVVCSSSSGKIVVPGSFGLTSYAGLTFRYFIFILPLNVAYQSSIIKSPSQLSAGLEHNFGIKYAKDGKDINSNDFRDFTIHSSARSPLLHAVIYQKGSTIVGGKFDGNPGIKWTPDLPYRPVYFAFYSTDNDTFIPLSTVSQVAPKVVYDPADNSIILNVIFSNQWGSLVLLKDPLDGAPRTSVNI